MNNLLKSLIISVATVNMSACAQETPAEKSDEFRSTSTVEETRAQISRVRTDDIWWTVYGEDQAWNFKNLHRFMPTVSVYRDGQVKMLEEAINPAIAVFEIETEEGSMPFSDFINSNHTTLMSLVILHKGKIAFEAYPRSEPYEKPVYWSVAKVFVSSVLAILEDRGEVDVSNPIDFYIEELRGSSFEGVKIRNILDMATGVECAEEYVDKESCYYQYSMTVGDGHFDENSPDNPYELLASIEVPRYEEQGTDFQYSGVNTFLLSWLVEKITGMPFQDAFSKEIWTKIGAESDGSYIAPRFGVPVTHGGFLARARDVARFGLLYTPSYTAVTDDKIISDRLINLLKNEGNDKLFERYRDAGYMGDDPKYPAYQWDQIYQNNDFYKGGWAGQGLLVNPDRDTVVVYTGYFKEDQSEVDMLPILRDMMNSLYGDQ